MNGYAPGFKKCDGPLPRCDGCRNESRLLSGATGLQVFAGYWGTPGPLAAFDGAGNFLPGWPRNSSNYVSTSPSAADVDGDGIDEVFVCEQDSRLHAYRPDGSSLPGWPVSMTQGAQSCSTPAIADLDADGALEILVVTSPANGISHMYAFRADGTRLAGFPVSFEGNSDTYPVVGDVDGDGAPEIVVVAKAQSYPYWHDVVQIYSAQGQLEREIHADEWNSKSAAPALADLDGDGIADIVMQGDAQLFAWRGTDGTLLPGWPAVTGRSGNSAPAVGDVDGDGQPDVVVTNALNQVRLFNRYGVSHPRFPKSLPLGEGAMPAIADLDRDGHNEIIVIGSNWTGFSGYYDNLWVYDLQGPAHGRIEWGQFGNDHRHQSRYVAVPNDGPRADLGVTLAANQQSIHVGQALTYTITVTNNGPALATNVQVLQSLSLNTSFQSASAACRHEAREVACTLPELAAGSSHSFTVAVTGGAAGSAESTVNVAATQVDPSLGHNAASIVTTISPASADLSIAITDTPDPVRQYRDLNYAISVVNRGPDTASGIRVEFRFPAGVRRSPSRRTARRTRTSPYATSAG